MSRIQTLLCYISLNVTKSIILQYIQSPPCMYTRYTADFWLKRSVFQLCWPSSVSRIWRTSTGGFNPIFSARRYRSSRVIPTHGPYFGVRSKFRRIVWIVFWPSGCTVVSSAFLWGCTKWCLPVLFYRASSGYKFGIFRIQECAVLFLWLDRFHRSFRYWFDGWLRLLEGFGGFRAGTKGVGDFGLRSRAWDCGGHTAVRSLVGIKTRGEGSCVVAEEAIRVKVTCRARWTGWLREQRKS